MSPQAEDGGLRILLVEDEVLLAIDMQERVEQLGHSVLGPAGSSEKAHQLLDGETPDGALLDVNLLGDSSASVARRLARKGVPCFVVTAYAQGELSEAALRDLPNLQKPVSDRELEEACCCLAKCAAGEE